MAGGQERILRRRIKSVQSTRKITKAMELIAASQITRSQARIVANRPYRDGMRRIIVEAAKADPAGAAKLLAVPERVYNPSALRAGERLVRKLENDGTAVQLFSVGKKAGAFYRFRGIDLVNGFVGMSDRPTFDDARQIAARVAAPFVTGEAQQVFLVSTRFLSAATQSVEVRQLLPLSLPEIPEDDGPKVLKGYTEFEPEVAKLLETLAPKALESEIFSALLEGAASFHVSQQRAMAAATENADELGQSLSRIMNRARQDSITTEIMEIVGGAEALRSGK
jgi:F-type H+-transporting ATPase subunit gamma